MASGRVAMTLLSFKVSDQAAQAISEDTQLDT